MVVGDTASERIASASKHQLAQANCVQMSNERLLKTPRTIQQLPSTRQVAAQLSLEWPAPHKHSTKTTRTRRSTKPLQEMKRRPTTHASNHAHRTHRRNWSWQNRPWWAEGDTPCQEPVDNGGCCELKCATHGGTEKPMQRTRTDETNWWSEHASMSTDIWWTPANNTTCLATRPQL